ncbi:MAG: hypothetical protein EOO45_14365 [Flavobacterium sp.]|nr:MAG: hypothetical protein EOO45_14365 [Flavobacterium sp.]
MKKIFLTLTILIVLACTAQSQIYPLYNNPDQGKVPGAYYKDTFGDFDNYIGTWKYTNGNIVFIITLQKKLRSFNPHRNFYRDVIVGGYSYVENGVEKINTLPQLLQLHDDVYFYSIVGSTINKAGNFPICDDCDPNQKRLILRFNDPERVNIEGLSGEIVLRRIESGGVQKLEVWLRQTGNVTYVAGSPPQYNALNVPWGTYILTKVN